MSRANHSAIGRAMLAVVAGLMVSPAATFAPTPRLATAGAQVQAPSREQSPAVLTTRSARKRRRRRTAHQSFGYDHALRRAIEQRIGRLSARQWVRVRRFLARAMHLHRQTPRPTRPLIIAHRLVPMFRETERGLVLLGLHDQGVAIVTEQRRTVGVPWTWLEGLA